MDQDNRRGEHDDRDTGADSGADSRRDAEVRGSVRPEGTRDSGSRDQAVPEFDDEFADRDDDRMSER
jgi:hypothetical protein